MPMVGKSLQLNMIYNIYVYAQNLPYMKFQPDKILLYAFQSVTASTFFFPLAVELWIWDPVEREI